MKKALYLLLVILMSVPKCSTAQNKKVDSLLALIKKDIEDTNKVNHLNSLCFEYKHLSEYYKGIVIGKQALLLGQKLGFKKAVARAYNNTGSIFLNQGNYPEALKYNFAALKIKEDIKDRKGMAYSYSNIGNIYKDQLNYTAALQNYITALTVYETINDKKGIAGSYMNIGLIYNRQGNYPEALKMLSASLKISKEIKDKWTIAASTNNIGLIYAKQGNYEEALNNFFISLKIKEEIGSKEGIAVSNGNIGNIYIKLNKLNDAEPYLNKCLKIAAHIGNKDIIKESYASYASLDSAIGNYKAAFEHHKLYIAYRDSLNNEETQKQSLQASMQYEFDKKEIASKVEQDKKDAIVKVEKQKQKIVIALVSCVLLLVVLFSFFLYNRFRITNKQKLIIQQQKTLVDKAYESLHEKNKEVMDSINYARRIQNALLPNEKYISKHLRN